MTNHDYGEFLTQARSNSSDGPLSASGPSDKFIPTFWPSRVPNNVITEEKYRIIIDRSKPLTERVAAFKERPFWLRSLGFLETLH